MELVFEVRNTTHSFQKTFKQAGGVIGRGEECEWFIPDSTFHLSSRHALISYRNGVYFFTDISTNGTRDGKSGALLRKNNELRIEHGNLYVMGDFEILARLLHEPLSFGMGFRISQNEGTCMPERALRESAPFSTCDSQEHDHSEIEAMILPKTIIEGTFQRADYARIDQECLLVPELIEAPVEPASAPTLIPAERQPDGFWDQYAAELGVDLTGLDQSGKEALALNAACLLRQSIDGLQQCLRTRSELKTELRLVQTSVQDAQQNPLKFAVDTSEALSMLLQPNTPEQGPAAQLISRAFGDLQAHQVAMLTASRATVRGTLEHFSPQQLTLRFERDNKPLIATSGSRWRAYCRYHQALREGNDWCERLLARDFAQAYEEQIRLISTLHIDHQG